MSCELAVVVIVDEWLMFDDENVSMIASEDILKLSGGGLVSLSLLSLFLKTFIASTHLILSSSLIHCCSLHSTTFMHLVSC